MPSPGEMPPSAKVQSFKTQNRPGQKRAGRLPMARREGPRNRTDGPTESERAELLARARMWDFLADHGPHVRAHE